MSNPNSQDLFVVTSAFIGKSCNLLVSAPLDRGMTIMQTQGTIKNLQTPYKGVLNCIARLYREEGFWHLWRGTSAGLLANVPKVFLNFPVKDFFKKILPQYNYKAQPLEFFVMNIMSGAIAGAATFIFTYPWELIRIQLQSDLGKDRKDRQFTGIRDCFGHIYRNSGIRGLYRGYLLSFVGIVVYRGWYFGMYDSMKKYIKAESLQEKFILAQGVTLSAGLVTYPFDTVRKRLCKQGGRIEPDYKNAMDCATKMVEKEGVKSLFRGFWFRTGLGVSGALALTIYEAFQSSLRL